MDEKGDPGCSGGDLNLINKSAFVPKVRRTPLEDVYVCLKYSSEFPAGNSEGGWWNLTVILIEGRGAERLKNLI